MKIDQSKLIEDDVMADVEHKGHRYTAIVRQGKLMGWSSPDVSTDDISPKTKWVWLHEEIKK